MRAATTPVRFLATCVLALILAGCAGAGGSADRPRMQRSVINEQELDGIRSDITTAFEAVERLRPEFLRPRGMYSVNNPNQVIVVYVDNMRAGGPEALHSIHIAQVLAIRYISAADATTRFGTGHAAGAIEVVTRRN